MPSEPLLAIRALTKRFPHSAKPSIVCVHVSLDRGRTLAIVGPSGAGKSTLARCIAMFEEPDSGEIIFEGQDLLRASRQERTRLRPAIQLVLQQPAAALNPRFTVEEVIAEPLVIQRRATPEASRRRAAEIIESIGLPPAAASRPALSLSGGERQRLALARALVLDPKLLILDESFSGLDLSIRAQMTELLGEAQRRLGTAYILIAHDLRLVARFADEIAVIDSGAIVERGLAATVLSHPTHPRTVRMLEAAARLSLETAPGEART
jgi:ABC-type glutathione transport system ATPase component